MSITIFFFISLPTNATRSDADKSCRRSVNIQNALESRTRRDVALAAAGRRRCLTNVRPPHWSSLRPSSGRSRRVDCIWFDKCPGNSARWDSDRDRRRLAVAGCWQLLRVADAMRCLISSDRSMSASLTVQAPRSTMSRRLSPAPARHSADLSACADWWRRPAPLWSWWSLEWAGPMTVPLRFQPASRSTSWNVVSGGREMRALVGFAKIICRRMTIPATEATAAAD